MVRHAEPILPAAAVASPLTVLLSGRVSRRPCTFPVPALPCIWLFHETKSPELAQAAQATAPALACRACPTPQKAAALLPPYHAFGCCMKLKHMGQPAQAAQATAPMLVPHPAEGSSVHAPLQQAAAQASKPAAPATPARPQGQGIQGSVHRGRLHCSVLPSPGHNLWGRGKGLNAVPNNAVCGHRSGFAHAYTHGHGREVEGAMPSTTIWTVGHGSCFAHNAQHTLVGVREGCMASPLRAPVPVSEQSLWLTPTPPVQTLCRQIGSPPHPA